MLAPLSSSETPRPTVSTHGQLSRLARGTATHACTPFVLRNATANCLDPRPTVSTRARYGYPCLHPFRPPKRHGQLSRPTANCLDSREVRLPMLAPLSSSETPRPTVSTHGQLSRLARGTATHAC